MTALRLGTRGSALATAQSGLVAAALSERTGREVELVEIDERDGVFLIGEREDDDRV